jgi:hypothetical protein
MNPPYLKAKGCVTELLAFGFLFSALTFFYYVHQKLSRSLGNKVLPWVTKLFRE